MAADPSDDIVSRQYERWTYPAPIEDLDAWLRQNWEWFDPSHAHPVLWPGRGYRADLDILIAGCGTNQAAVFARTNPAARILAVDVSRASLDHQQSLKHRYGLDNLELQQRAIEDLPSLGRGFDLIVSTGVIHHLADPLAGMRALAACLRPTGVMGVMLYAKYGRVGVEILESVFRDLGLRQDEASLRVVRQVLAMLPQAHPVQAYLKSAPDLASDAGLVDTFLHGRQRSYSVDDCLELVRAAGLTFQDWLLHAPCYAHGTTGPDAALRGVVDALPEARMWSVMERIHATNARHFFMACRPERAAASYRIEFALPACLGYVPVFRMRCGLDGDCVFRPDWRTRLDPAQRALLQGVDGRRSIGEIIALAAGSEPVTENLRMSACERFRAWWRLDLLAMRLPDFGRG